MNGLLYFTKRDETKGMNLYWNEHIKYHNSQIPPCDNVNKRLQVAYTHAQDVTSRIK